MGGVAYVGAVFFFFFFLLWKKKKEGETPVKYHNPHCLFTYYDTEIAKQGGSGGGF
jgi:hypothetical protein